jgi:alkyl hydroperoxide reductase subunit AhpC
MFRSLRLFQNVSRRTIAAVTKPAPAFAGQAVVNGQFSEISLDGYLKEGKWVCLFFYPLDFTFVCPTELIGFSDIESKFAAANCQLVGCSVDSHFSHLAWNQMERKKGGLGGVTYPLLADFSKQISKDYGVLIDAAGGISLRGLFLIDPTGNVRHMVVNDLPVGRSPDEALRILHALQFVEEHGEVCPANWTPGAKTINPGKAHEYFESAN